ncbi:MAG TPA: protein kinase [Urbifossiella sp.]|jgi:serine/threonine-protein kinase|nr:protein kinase [Urbifossiella sp.]
MTSTTRPRGPDGEDDGDFLPPDDLAPAATLPLGPVPWATPPAITPPPDTGQRYQAVAEIARGAMGVVYRGRDTAFGRPVAIKLLLDEHLSRPELRWRFAEEVRIAAALQHPSVVPVYDTGTCPTGRPFYVMRMVEGGTLDALLAARRDTGRDRSRFLKVFEKVCEGVAFAHSRGVIHRDVKPDNVMVGDLGLVQLMDWGVSKVLPHSPVGLASPEPPAAGRIPADPADLQTRFGRVLGTPAYMSPEQARGHLDQMDERTDVFALGGLLCTILTGAPPYTGANARLAYKQAARADLADGYARLDASGADPELVALGKQCLSPVAGDRPRDAGALAAALAECLAYDLRRAERDLVRFFELTPDLFCIAGMDGFFRRVNANFTRVLGHPAADLLAHPFIDFVHPCDQDRTRAVLADLARGELCVRFRNRYRDVRGDYRWFEWQAKPLVGEGMVFAVARDVTDTVRLEGQARFFDEE